MPQYFGLVVNIANHYLNHDLKSLKNSKYVFYCEKCSNLVKFERSMKYLYYLNYTFGNFYPLTITCEEMIIKNIIE